MPEVKNKAVLSENAAQAQNISDDELDLSFLDPFSGVEGNSRAKQKVERDRKAVIKSYLENHRRQENWGPATHARIMAVQVSPDFFAHSGEPSLQTLGTLERRGIEDSFTIKTNKSGFLPVLEVEENYLCFIRRYVGSNVIFDFRIEQVGGKGIVTEIRRLKLPGDSLLMCDKLDDLQIQDALLRCGRTVRSTMSSDIPKAVFSSEDELSWLYALCRGTYPPHVRVWVDKQFSQLKQGLCGSEDRRHILRSLADVLCLNWERPELRVPSPDEIRNRFRAHFFGMDYVLQEIQEICACIRANGAFPQRGILLSGAPGTGKTDVLAFFAELLGLPLIRIDVARLLNAESVLGTSRIYANARSGELWNGIVSAGTVCAVVVLEEADKECGKENAKTQPVDAFLNVLEGSSFYEEFLELSIPTDGLFFAATANDTSTLNPPLLSRFRKIDIPAYSSAEKREILYRHIFPEIAAMNSVAPQEVSFSPDAEHTLLSEYGIEPGVRELKSYAEKVFRNYVYRKSEESLSGIVYTEAELRKMLGPPPALSRNLMQLPGCVFAAVFNEQRAAIIPIQATTHPGSGELIILNASGEHQKSQIKIAYAFVKSLFPDELSHTNITIALMVEIKDKTINDIGCAAAIAMLASLHNVSFTSKEIFLGGCDLFGTIFLDHSTIDPLVACLPESVTTIYAPTGTNRLIYHTYSDAKVGIVEMPNALSLFQVISGRSKI